MTRTILTLILSFRVIALNAQTFEQNNFKVKLDCNLENVLTTVNGVDNVSVYECTKQGTSTSVFRIIVIGFKEKITDKETYINDIKRDYLKLGETSFIKIGTEKAVQVSQKVTIEGRNFKQIWITFLYKNKGFTLVLITNSDNAMTLLDNFKKNFSLL